MVKFIGTGNISTGVSVISSDKFMRNPRAYSLAIMVLGILCVVIVFSINGKAICEGPVNAKAYVVYLHGMNKALKPDPLERQNREVLKRLADELSLKIALPRGTETCSDFPDYICWSEGLERGEYEPNEVSSKILSPVNRAVNRCFPKGVDFGVIGFSKGGQAVNKLVQLCIETPFKWFVSVGATGTWSMNDPKDLSRCGSLTMLIGKYDKYNLESSKELYNHLKKLGGNVNLIEFEGGHYLPYGPLKEVLLHLVEMPGSAPAG